MTRHLLESDGWKIRTSEYLGRKDSVPKRRREKVLYRVEKMPKVVSFIRYFRIRINFLLVRKMYLFSRVAVKNFHTQMKQQVENIYEKDVGIPMSKPYTSLFFFVLLNFRMG